MICKYCGKTTGALICEHCEKDNSFPLRGEELEKLLERNKNSQPAKNAVKKASPIQIISEKAVIDSAEEDLKTAYHHGYGDGYQMGVKEGYTRGLNQCYNNGKAEPEYKDKILPTDTPKSRWKKNSILFGMLCLLGTLIGGLIGVMIGHKNCMGQNSQIRTSFESYQSISAMTSTPVISEESINSDASEVFLEVMNQYVAADEDEENPAPIIKETEYFKPELTPDLYPNQGGSDEM